MADLRDKTPSSKQRIIEGIFIAVVGGLVLWWLTAGRTGSSDTSSDHQQDRKQPSLSATTPPEAKQEPPKVISAQSDLKLLPPKAIKIDVDTENKLLTELDHCVLKHNKLGCFFTITNRSDHATGYNLMGGGKQNNGSRIIDDSGGVYYSSTVLVGYETGTNWETAPYERESHENIPPNVKVQAMMVFENVAPETKSLQQVMAVYTTRGLSISRYGTDFKNIPLQTVE